MILSQSGIVVVLSLMDDSWIMSDLDGSWMYEPPGIIIRYVRFTPVRTMAPDRFSPLPNSPSTYAPVIYGQPDFDQCARIR